VSTRVVTGFSSFPGSVRTNAGVGVGSGLDRRSTRVAGLALMPSPIGAESSRRERDGGEVVGGRVSPLSVVDIVAIRVSGCRSSLRHRHGVAGSGTAAARRSQSESSTAPLVGVRPATTARPGCGRRGCSCWSRQATHVSVAQRVVDQVSSLRATATLAMLAPRRSVSLVRYARSRRVEALHRGDRFPRGPDGVHVTAAGRRRSRDGGQATAVRRRPLPEGPVSVRCGPSMR
jgi:hypothetical protein